MFYLPTQSFSLERTLYDFWAVEMRPWILVEKRHTHIHTQSLWQLSQQNFTNYFHKRWAFHRCATLFSCSRITNNFPKSIDNHALLILHFLWTFIINLNSTELSHKLSLYYIILGGFAFDELILKNHNFKNISSNLFKRWQCVEGWST